MDRNSSRSREKKGYCDGGENSRRVLKKKKKYYIL